MAVTFALRSTSLDAYYSKAGKTPAVFNASVDDDASFIGGKKINLDKGGSGTRFLIYPGGANIPAGKEFSLAYRWAGPLTGLPPGICGLMSFGRWLPASQYWGMFGFQVAAAGIQAYLTNETGAAGFNGTNIFPGYQYPDANTAHDWLITFDGTTNANGLKLWIDGVLVAQGTSTQAWPEVRNLSLASSIAFGVSPVSTTTRHSLNEAVLLDQVRTPSQIVLEGGGTGLAGPSRTAFIAVDQYDGQSYTDPGIENVRNAVQYYFGGIQRLGGCVVPASSDVRLGRAVDAATGLCAVPIEADTKHGVATDVGIVGTYRGEDLYTELSADKIKHGEKQTFNGAEREGTYRGSDLNTDPGTDNVLDGVSYLADGVEKTGALSKVEVTELKGSIDDGCPESQGVKTITAGESPVFNLTATVEGGTPFDLRGMTACRTKFVAADKSERIVAGFTAVDLASGKFRVELSKDDTEALKIARGQTFVSIITIGAKEYYIWFDKLLDVRKSSLISS